MEQFSFLAESHLDCSILRQVHWSVRMQLRPTMSGRRRRLVHGDDKSEVDAPLILVSVLVGAEDCAPVGKKRKHRYIEATVALQDVINAKRTASTSESNSNLMALVFVCQCRPVPTVYSAFAVGTITLTLR